MTELVGSSLQEVELRRARGEANRVRLDSSRSYCDILDFQQFFILFDLDHLQAINDGYGHPAGDRVLVTGAETLRQSSRETDLAVRLGGDEFALLLPETDAVEAACVAERVRRPLESTPIFSDGARLTTTVSAGVKGSVGQFAPTDPATLLGLVDQMVYRAKEQGRDQVAVGQMNGEELRSGDQK